MAQLERIKRISMSPKTPKSQNSSSFEQLLKVEETYWSPTSSPTSRRSRDQADPFSPSPKKSVLTIVKERAKKLKHTLSGRRKQEIDHNNDHTNHSHRVPSWGVNLEDDAEDLRDEDPEYLGAPMYESEAAPETLKETARQHPRAEPVVSEKHRLPKRANQDSAKENENPVSPNMTMTKTVSEKLGPAYSAMSDATNKVVSKLSGLAIATQETPEREVVHTRGHSGGHEIARNSAEIIAAAPPPSSEAKKLREDGGNMKQYSPNSSQTWDKGVSVKEYFMHKLEPGDDERALSQAITEAISPRKTTTDSGVMEKVKEAVTSLFWQDETSNSIAKAASLPSSSTSTQQNLIGSTIAHSATANSSTNNDHSSKVQYRYCANSSPLIPLSSNAYEVHEEENHGKILQAN